MNVLVSAVELLGAALVALAGAEGLLKEFASGELEALGVLWTPAGYLAVTRLHGFLRLVGEFGDRFVGRMSVAAEREQDVKARSEGRYCN